MPDHMQSIIGMLPRLETDNSHDISSSHCSLQKFSNELDHGSMEVAEKVLAQLIRELLTMELWVSPMPAL